MLKFSDVKAGDVLLPDGGFTCIEGGDARKVLEDGAGELFVACAGGRHYLKGQADENGVLIGLTRAEQSEVAE